MKICVSIKLKKKKGHEDLWNSNTKGRINTYFHWCVCFCCFLRGFEPGKFQFANCLDLRFVGLFFYCHPCSIYFSYLSSNFKLILLNEENFHEDQTSRFNKKFREYRKE